MSWDDPGLDARFQKFNGPRNESFFSSLRRGYRAFCKSFFDPTKKHWYEGDALKSENFEVFEFDLRKITGSVSEDFHVAYWRYIDDIKTKNGECGFTVIYMHANNRSAVDAVELCPICRALKCDLLAFDLPGHGKTGGDPSLTPRSVMECLTSILEWLHQRHKTSEPRYILWARGMSTAVAIEYCAGDTLRTELIRGLVLDTPFISVDQLVTEARQRLAASGINFLPGFMISAGVELVRRGVAHGAGYDPMLLRPIEFAPKAKISCLILAPTNDDCVGTNHAETIAAVWGNDTIEISLKKSLREGRSLDNSKLGGEGGGDGLCKPRATGPAAALIHFTSTTPGHFAQRCETLLLQEALLAMNRLFDVMKY